jgi:hypothetical protein
MADTITKPDVPVREDPIVNPDEVRRPKEFCPDQKSRGAWEIC